MKKAIVIAMLFLLVIPLSLGYVYLKPEDIRFRTGGVERFNPYFYDPRVQTFKQDVWVYLTPPEPPIFATGQPAIYPRATARVQSVRSPYLPNAYVTIKTKDLRPSEYDNTYYQAWLLDTDTGYSLNLGLFDTVGGGVGTLDFRSKHYLDPYDFVVITREPRDDKDPKPSTDVVLMGRIVWQKYYVPSLLGEKEQTGYSYERQ
ncbi:MAG: anti-sigma factor [Candidatus Woesearchaeota archaeon]